MGTNSWTIDTSRMPLVITTFGARIRDDDDVREMIAAADALFASKERFLHVLDLTSLVSPANYVQRRIMAQWHRRVRATSANSGAVATAVIVRSALVRGALTSVLWLSTTSTERIEVFPTMEAATQWLARVAKETGMPFPVDAVASA